MAVSGPSFVDDPGRILVGMHAPMSFVSDATPELFRRFMPRRGEIEGRIGTDVHCVRVLPADAGPPGPDTVFERWAAVQVAPGTAVPDGMEVLEVPAGRWAVFRHTGPMASFGATMAHIFGAWLPASGEVVDERPQFEVLAEGWRAEDPDATEEVWVPLR